MSTTLKDVDNIIHKYIDFMYINSGSVKITYNDKAWYVRTNSPPAIAKINVVIKSLPDTIGYFEYPNNTFIFAPIESPQQKVDFAEIQAVAIGYELLEKQKKVLEVKTLYKESLQNMLNLKKTLDIPS